MAVVSFKCPNCDGELIFDPATQKYKCEYCRSIYDQAQLDAMMPATAAAQQEATQSEDAGTESEPETDAAASDDAFSHEEEEAVTYSCPSCGAEIVTDKTTAATFCYYCHNPVVLGERLEGSYLPNKVIPFTIDRKQAQSMFLEHVGRKKFVPKGFFNKKNIEKLSGVYFPYWLYSAEMDGHVSGDAKKVRTWITGDTEYTETKVYSVTRDGSIALSNLSENALKKANSKLAEGVMPYRFQELKDFHMGFLSGFFAEKRDIEQTEVQQQMQQELRQDAEKVFRGSIQGYSLVNVQSANFRPITEDFQYVLLPVWTITYKGSDGKIYYFSMNGQTGKTCGQLPIDKKKLFVTALAVFGIVLAAGLLGGFLL